MTCYGLICCDVTNFNSINGFTNWFSSDTTFPAFKFMLLSMLFSLGYSRSIVSAHIQPRCSYQCTRRNSYENKKRKENIAFLGFGPMIFSHDVFPQVPREKGKCFLCLSVHENVEEKLVGKSCLLFICESSRLFMNFSRLNAEVEKALESWKKAEMRFLWEINERMGKEKYKRHFEYFHFFFASFSSLLFWIVYFNLFFFFRLHNHFSSNENKKVN